MPICCCEEFLLCCHCVQFNFDCQKTWKQSQIILFKLILKRWSGFEVFLNITIYIAGWREGGHKRTGYFSDFGDSAVHAGKSRDYETQHRKQQSSHESSYNHERSYKGWGITQHGLVSVIT